MTDLLFDDRARLFQENDVIGKGGFGKVFRVYNKLDDQYYAIKKILLTENSVRGALHEIRILAKINHPHIVRYYNSWVESKPLVEESFQDDDDDNEVSDDIIVRQDRCFYCYIQMEYCTGTLKTYLRDCPDVRQDRVLCEQILNGLHFLHLSGVIHRDIKPDNILVYRRDPIHVKISDFGLAKVFSSKLHPTESTLYTGSTLYASPEQYNGLSYSFPTDIYSTGIVFLELFSRFTTEMERITSIRALRDERRIPKDIRHADTILRMTETDPSLRPTTNCLLYHYFCGQDQPLLHCRDIVWEIVMRASEMI
jgi:serine/threonine protein kinase